MNKILQRMLGAFPVIIDIALCIFAFHCCDILSFNICMASDVKNDKDENIELTRLEKKSHIASDKKKLPLPRFASIRSKEVNFRSGPYRNSTIERICKCRNLPVQIIQEFEHWRLVKDFWGHKGWIHVSLLSPRPTALVFVRSRCALKKDGKIASGNDKCGCKDNSIIFTNYDNTQNNSALEPVIIVHDKQDNARKEIGNGGKDIDYNIQKLEVANNKEDAKSDVRDKDARLNDVAAATSQSDDLLSSNSDYILIRRLPSNKAIPIAKVLTCSVLKVMRCDDVWCNVIINHGKLFGKSGWMKREYLWGIDEKKK